MIGFLKRYSHGLWALAYLLFIYLPWYTFLEENVNRNYHLIHMALDDILPFNEIFVIPYLMWFPYVLGTILWFVFTEKNDYWRLVAFLSIGMTIFLIIATLYPNGCQLRPSVFPRDNFCTMLVLRLYHSDTSTNIFPSIHVYNSLGVHFAVMNSRNLSKNKKVHIFSLIMCTLIITSTMCLKQHSSFDVIGAFIMATVMYFLVYVLDLNALVESHKPMSQLITCNRQFPA
jgi:membrane-associated phospholipid phosphatase